MVGLLELKRPLLGVCPSKEEPLIHLTLEIRYGRCHDPDVSTYSILGTESSNLRVTFQKVLCVNLLKQLSCNA